MVQVHEQWCKFPAAGSNFYLVDWEAFLPYLFKRFAHFPSISQHFSIPSIDAGTSPLRTVLRTLRRCEHNLVNAAGGGFVAVTKHKKQPALLHFLCILEHLAVFC